MIKFNEIDLESILSIDKYKLDEECIKHPSIYQYYADIQAELKTEMLKAKDLLDLKIADEYIRIKSEYVGGGKITEANLTSMIAKSDEVVECRNNCRSAELMYNKITALVEALNSKRSSLDNLVKLYCAGYFSAINHKSKNIDEMVSDDIRKSINMEVKND